MAKQQGAEKSGGAPTGKPSGGKKWLLLSLPVVVALAGAGLWFSGILPGLLGMGGEAVPVATDAGPGAVAGNRAPVFFDMPEIVANLNVPGRRATYIKLRSKLELASAADSAVVQAAMPRLLDLFTTYVRELRPEELRGSAGTQRLREELLARANLVAAPARVTDVLFQEILVQ